MREQEAGNKRGLRLISYRYVYRYISRLSPLRCDLNALVPFHSSSQRLLKIKARITNKKMMLISFYLTLISVVLGGTHGFLPPASCPRQSVLVSPPATTLSPPTTLHRPPTATARSTTMQHVLSPIAATAASMLRGGAKEIALNLGHEGLKMQSMATYSTITALIMNASLRLYTSQKFNIQLDADGKRPRRIQWLESIFTASTILCIVCGVFTAVLFNILGIYSKEALGMGNESGYLAFRDATAVFRKWGFRAFMLTAVSFVTSFLTSVVEKTSNEDFTGQVILVASIILAMVGVFHIHTVLTLATKYIYTAAAMAENHIA